MGKIGKFFDNLSDPDYVPEEVIKNDNNQPKVKSFKLKTKLHKLLVFIGNNWILVLVLCFSYIAMTNSIEANDHAKRARYNAGDAADYARRAQNAAEDAAMYAEEAADDASYIRRWSY